MIDAHHHIWRQADLPWLTGPMQPRIFGPYEPIRRDYLMAEYLRDVTGTGITQSVYVQANWPPAQAVREAEWVAAVAAETGWPHAIVAYADVAAPDVRPQLDRLAKIPFVRGIRMQLHWHDNPMYRFAASPDQVRDPAVLRNVGMLADYGYAFDLQVFPPQMPDAAELAAACPQVTFVLQHAGMPEDLSDEGLAVWRTGMDRLAGLPNVVCKLSGLGTFIHRNDPAHIAGIVHAALGWFGPQRCLFGSNFPIEKLWTDYPSLFAAYRSATGGLDAAEQAAVFGGTARRVYRIAA